MRGPRCKIEFRVAVYHIFSRVVDRLFKFDDATKDAFRDLIWKVATFSGVEVITYAIMSNHFHILVRVQPKWTTVDEEEVKKRVGYLYGAAKKQWLTNKLNHLHEKGDLEGIKALLDVYRARMNDVSEFMKTLKLRMTISFNDAHHRVGTLWEGRFGSILLEDTPNSELLRLTAAYIDLNSVRAKIVRDPQKYSWSGFGNTFLTKAKRAEKAQQGIASLYQGMPGKELEEYGKLLRARAFKKGMNGQEDHPGLHPLTCLHVRNDTLMRGRAIGSQAFIKDALGSRPAGGVTPCHNGKDGPILVAGCLTRRKTHV